ncbi:MAG: HPr family phosphocarrier protein [Phycisphaerales bacterium]|nr:HPr family phosphocarrier protein [Phycisphaerales bacterium]
MVLERELTVTNREGLHFRPIMQLVEVASKFSSRVRIRCGDREADARSPMELLMLVATQGCSLMVTIEGDDAPAAMDALSQLFSQGFGET